MFDFGAGELVVIGVVALVAIGPKELPGLLRTVGQAIGKMRRMASDFQGQFNDAMREADLAEAQKMLSDLKTDMSGLSTDPTPPPAFPMPEDVPAPALAVEVPTVEAPVAEAMEEAEVPAPKKRSRKPKVDEAAPDAASDTEDAPVEEKPKRRRATKKPDQEEAAS